ncbi:MAG: sigma-70 family RNA polymerase sigma factor, partial [Oscillospiraceae bacterium]|nr:sigma-70 family RNA polymerase sigma factor [Oscillospiraceae bacterium]
MDRFSVEILRSMPDEELVSVCTDLPQAFEILFERYRPAVVSMANAYAVNAADAEDYVQEGMFGLLAAVAANSQERSAGFRTFAGVCIRNRMRNLYRREKAGQRKSGDLPDVSLDDPENRVAEMLADQAETPEEIVLEKEQASALHRQIAEVLSRQEREIFLLFVNGLSYDEIAAR